MAKWRWVWIVAIVLVLAGGSYFVYQAVAGERHERRVPRPKVEKATDEILQLNRIKAAASSGTLTEAYLEDGEWVVKAEENATSILPYELFTRVRNFYLRLAITDVALKNGELTIKTDAVKDKWGHAIKGLTVVRIAFGKEAFENINWSGIEPLKLEKVADELWVHEEVRKRLEEEEMKKKLESLGISALMGISEGGGGGGGGGEGGEGGGGGSGGSGGE